MRADDANGGHDLLRLRSANLYRKRTARSLDLASRTTRQKQPACNVPLIALEALLHGAFLSRGALRRAAPRPPNIARADRCANAAP
jgi:hypothetical protein